MTSRELPVEEWGKLPAHFQQLNPAYATVIVVEDGDQIVGHWALVTNVHAEGLWIDPAHQGKGAVAARLWRALHAVAKLHGLTQVLTQAETPTVIGLVEHAGGEVLPGTLCAVPVGE